ncbi:tRNA (adenosine(37)-N6)-threonylcarbamoyltransferase complex transferase subunit TsaD [Candidatus Gottesmanbacteria bacterium]|nr:tRNA (adenosine(37)-N6)-threonylcarbamoyltransferase complex transferase subunit TsaD [Candidatus Gottesmanbacteria bacterium]
MKILAIESSADETAAAIVENGTKIISSAVASSTEMHKKWGGIVPEIAARKQLECIIPVISDAVSGQDYDAIAVTVGPGLIGSLLVGVETAKTIAFVTGKPIIPVNHVIAHIYANFVNPSLVIPGLTRNPSSSNTGSRRKGRDDKKEIQFPAISLVASGGHTELYLMKSVKDLTWLGGTLDDAAGECFDKTARLLGFENRGGEAIAAAAAKFKMQNAKFKIKLPRPMMFDENFNFSFSGLKTAVVREWTRCHPAARAGMTNAFAYEIQEAITDVLVKKTLRAAQKYDAKSILLSGGVAANTRLRKKFSILHSLFSIHAPPPALCTDNAVYIASYAFFQGNPVDWHKITAVPDLIVEA